MYKQLTNAILRLADNAFIPLDPANRDYQEYLDWIAEGNTPLPPDQPTLDQAKRAQIAAINTDMEAAAAALTADYPPSEKLSWPIQEQEALAWQADNTTATPYIDALALERGIARVDYLQRTLAKVQQFRAASAQLIGKRQRLEDQIKAATTLAAVQAIVW